MGSLTLTDLGRLNPLVLVGSLPVPQEDLGHRVQDEDVPAVEHAPGNFRQLPNHGGPLALDNVQLCGLLAAPDVGQSGRDPSLHDPGVQPNLFLAQKPTWPASNMAFKRD